MPPRIAEDLRRDHDDDVQVGHDEQPLPTGARAEQDVELSPASEPVRSADAPK